MGTKDKILYQMRQKLVMMDSFIETLLDEVGDAVYYQDGDLVYRFFNEDYLLLVNKTAEEVHGHDIYNVFPQKQADIFHEDDLEVLRLGIRKSYETTIEHPNGSKIIIEVIKRPHIDEDNNIIGIFGIIKDITILREKQKQLDMLDQVKKVFLDINRNILKHKSEHEFFDNIQMEIQSVFDQSKQSSVLVIDENLEMRILVHRGYVDYEVDEFHMPLDNSYYYKHNKGDFESAFYVNDVNSYLGDEDIPVITSEEEKPVRSSLCIPLIHEKNLKYIISIDSTKADAFNETDRLVAEFISKELPIIYKIFELHQVTLRLSKYDGLTGLYNRRTFNSIVEDKIKDLGVDEKLTLVIIDVDNLKLINDKFGHSAGDQYITDLVSEINMIQSEQVLFGRIGGDEFSGIFLGNDYDARTMMNQVQKQFEAKEIHVGGISFKGSFSYGLANINIDGHERSSLMQVADLRMYKNKMSKKEKSL